MPAAHSRPYYEDDNLTHFKKLISIETDECIEWDRGRLQTGYGRIGKRWPLAHRAALILSGSPEPFKGAHARHRCHNRPCVNPKHLCWGTALENTVDRTEREMGRFIEDVIDRIVAAELDGESRDSIRSRFGVSEGTMDRILGLVSPV